MRRAIMALLCGLLVAALPAGAQDYPTKPIRIVVPFAAGGPIDLEARLVGRFLEARLKQSVVIDNRPGSGGVIGAEVVAKAPADGYTLLYTGGALATMKVMFSKLSFDPIRDFEPISILKTFATVLATSKHVPAKTLAEFVAYAKTKPGALNYGSLGRGPIMLSMEALKKEAGINLVEIQYPGQAQATPALLSNDIQLTVLSLDSAQQLMKSGDIVVLAALGDTRFPQVPDVPTTKELGYKTVIASLWGGLLAPAGTPKPIIDRLAAESVAFVQTPEEKQRAATSVHIPVGSTPQEFRDAINGDYRIWQGIAEAINFKPE